MFHVVQCVKLFIFKCELVLVLFVVELYVAVYKKCNMLTVMYILRIIKIFNPFSWLAVFFCHSLSFHNPITLYYTYLFTIEVLWRVVSTGSLLSKLCESYF